jgi:hypothetical protein
MKEVCGRYPYKFQLMAEYYQFYLEDELADTDEIVAWTDGGGAHSVGANA